MTLLVGCGDVGAGAATASAGSASSTNGETSGGNAETGGGTDNGTSEGSDSTGDTKFDLPPDTTTGATGDVVCQGDGGGGDDGGGPGDCKDKAEPGSFEAAIQWTFDAPGEPQSYVIPLVANFTDDDGDGKIDVCTDIPDVVVVANGAYALSNARGHIYVLDGKTGALHFKIAHEVDACVTPALGDIDGDGMVELVTAVPGDYLIAFEHDGTRKWQSEDLWLNIEALCSSIALADLDNDGDVEIIAGTRVYDHTGKHLWTTGVGYDMDYNPATAVADLDGDGDLEVVLGHAAYHHDGSEYYLAADVAIGFPQIVNLDGDPEPEVLVTGKNGLTMLEHTGQVKYLGLRPTGDAVGISTWVRPAAVHDFDGNGVAEFATSSALHYTVYNGDATVVWSSVVEDKSGSAGGTAFDFLGDGKAEAMYADEYNFSIFDDKGVPYFEVPRSSATTYEYPTVADLDNDGSAEVAVVSMIGILGEQTSPTLQVIRDVQDRWIPARRIWNQHTYHVTNVHEDGRIPQFEQPSWKQLNTFRTQAQISPGGVCKPEPEG